MKFDFIDHYTYCNEIPQGNTASFETKKTIGLFYFQLFSCKINKEVAKKIN